jgi:macrolide transport system ATP-binding/permease protein
MTPLRVLASRIRALFSMRRIDRDFEQELESHLAMLTEENVRRGMPREEARRAARLRLGNPADLREANHELRGWALVETFFRDVAYAFRMLRKSPGFTLVAVLTIALGIGANTAIFSIVNSVLLRPLPVPHPGQIVVLAFQQKGGDVRAWFSYPNYRDIGDQSSAAFSEVAAYRTSFDGLSVNGQSDRILTSYVTGNYFSMLGFRPALGRLIDPSEGDVMHADPVVVLGYAYWRSRFAGDPHIIGRKVSINGQPVTVIGVAPAGFHGLFSMVETQAYLPMSMAVVGNPTFRSMLANRAGGPFLVLGRLKPGVSLSQAQAMLGVVARRLSSDHPRSDSELSLSAYPETLARPFPSAHNPLLKVAALFLALAALVLLLACVNIVNLLLVRAAVRRREMAVRSALGGSRSRLIRQLLTESLLLAFLGGAAGIVLGIWTSATAASVKFSSDLPLLLDFHFDWRVFLYAFAASLVTGLLVGIVPALRAAGVAPATVLHEGGRNLSPGRQRLRTALVVAQVAGSLVLLVIAGLFTRSLERAQHVRLGFDPSHLLNVSMDPHEIGYSDAQARQFYQALIERVRALPGVRSASLAFTVPMRYYTTNSDTLDIAGYTPPPGKAKPVVAFNIIGPGYFRTLGIPLVGGRSFTDADDEQARSVAIINETMAERFWPHEDPIGRKFRLTSAPNRWLEVVGVAADSKMLSIVGPNAPYFFLPIAQMYMSYQTLQLRTAGPPAAMIPAVRSLVASLTPGLPLFDVGTMDEALSSSGFLLFRFGAVLAAALGVLGLILAVVGVYGVTSYATARRAHEIGIRLALGAHPWQILRMILSQGALVVGIGLALGLLGTLAAARMVGSFLIISATDPTTYAVVSFVLAVIALLACYVPARRAMRVDPAAGLRHE